MKAASASESPAKQTTQEDVRGELPLFAVAACTLAFLTLVHEFGYAFAGGFAWLAVDGSYLSCLLRSVGIGLGGTVALAPFVRLRAECSPQRLAICLLGAVLALCALSYVAIGASWPIEMLCLVGMAASAAATVLLALCISFSGGIPVRTLALGLACTIALGMVAEYAASAIAHLWPLAIVAAFHLSFAAAALMVVVRKRPFERKAPSDAPAARPGQQADRSESASAKPPRPWQPIIHFLCYGFAIGFLHTALGVFRILGPERYLFSLLGSALAVGLLLATYTRATATSREVWTNLRRIVFPLITGFVMITSLFHSFFAYTFLYVSSCYYGCLFVLGCVFAMDQTVVPRLRIASVGFMVLGLGLTLGSLCGIFPLLFDQRDDQAILSFCIMLAFSAVTLGTFWIGDDHALRTWWGLRRKLTAKQYRDQEIRKRCRSIAKTYLLSEREEEVLLLLAQGRRAAQIKDDLSISVTTVRTHTRNIYSKLDVHSAKQLADVVETTIP
ncbi:LuxR C-terminal-related transcriptional regulator [Adlercreutzia aquisgranensis]|uniref:LuxR C-terminal-related transcriptional regulator n=1 Tax=Adlercreutzia aquisgranensis TaxID=2941323 RepID=UPI00203BD9FC|nr:LuxR C-terminal-related transcriptional regulator [Adlercreutzia aquisgranensis]